MGIAAGAAAAHSVSNTLREGGAGVAMHGWRGVSWSLRATCRDLKFAAAASSVASCHGDASLLECCPLPLAPARVCVAAHAV